MPYDEPIPPFATRYKGKLESCLGEPFQTFDGKYLHPTLVKRAAVLFYLVIKNHPFINGNKRMAVTLTLVFFYVNKRWLDASPNGLYRVARRIATNPTSRKDEFVGALERFFQRHLVDL